MNQPIKIVLIGLVGLGLVTTIVNRNLGDTKPIVPPVPQVTVDDAFHNPQVNSIVVYGASWCHYCTELKAKLKAKGIKYTYKDIDNKDNLNEMISKSGQSYVPQVYVNGRFIGSGSLL